MGSKQFIRNKKGITLIELLLTLSLLGLLIVTSFSLFLFGNTSFSMGSQQSNVQNEIRIALDSLTKEIRFATDVQIIGLEEASNSTSWEHGYSYFFIEGGKLYHIMYQAGTNIHKSSYYGSNIDSGSTIFTQKGSVVLGIKITSQYQNQWYTAETEVSLINLKTSANNIIGSSGLGLKYK